jgi:ketosteroid isomerase-like protein
MIDASFARGFAAEWIEAWNAHDLDRILAHYADDFEMISRLIVERGHDPSGRLKGKAAVRLYWAEGLAAKPPLRFTLEQVLLGVDSVVVIYRRASGHQAAETFFFDAEGKVVRAAAHYA